MSEELRGGLLLDTHVWIWTVEGAVEEIGAETVELVESAAAAGEIRVAAISVWEVAMLESRGRLSLSLSIDDWVQRALRAPGVRLVAFAPEVAIESTRLPGEVHGDPADRMIMASARVLGSRLVTRDRAILGYGKKGHLDVMDASR